MMEDRSGLCLLVVILVVYSLAAAGCTSIPGPNPARNNGANRFPDNLSRP